MNEEALIRSLKSGDEQGFSLFYQLYADKVYSVAVGVLQQREEAEDVTQEVFVSAYRSIHGFKGESSLGTWLYRITISRSLDAMRRMKRKPSDSLPDNMLMLTDASPQQLLELKEMGNQLWQAIGQLPDKQRVALILHKVEQLSYREIAEIMELSESAVDSLIFRARTNLRDGLNRRP